MVTKAALLASGKELMAEFCTVNQLSQPEVINHERDQWRFDSVCAYYRQDRISICQSACAAIGVAGQAWSYPGWMIDRTPHGVIAHELGHHVDYVLSQVKGAYGGDFSVKLRATTKESKITNYCPNDWEWFAEIFRLFVTNSDLLAHLRPRTYRQLRETYKPVVDAPYAVVLKDAPERTQEMAMRRVREATQ